jgi:zinc/manganese transport system permease protein
MEHFKSLLANDLLFTATDEFCKALALYIAIGLLAWKLYPKTSGFRREMLFFTLLSVTVTSSVQLAGVLVVFVLLIAPILVASMQTKFPLYPFAVAFGWSFSIIAIILSYFADLPTGYTIAALGALSTLMAVLVLSPKKETTIE